MKIYNSDGIEIIDGVNDDSYRQQQIMSQNNVTVYLSYTDALRIPVGSYIEYEGLVYTLERLPNLKKNGSRDIEHTLIFESPQAKLSKYKLRNIADKKLKFPFTAKPSEHLKLIVDNLNMRDSGWEMGECIDAVEAVVSFNHTYINEALSMVAEAFDTEWEIIDKTIHLRKIEYNKDIPLELSYGRGNGFKKEISRTISDSSKSIEILFTQGGERNIDFSKYGSSELLLPKNQTIRYDGSKFEGEEGFNSEIAKTYVTDEEGYSLQELDKPLKTHNEGSLDCTNIYPKRVGEVTGVEVVNSDKNLYDFFDTTIPENLDYSQYRIDGEKMTIAFQSGMLTGKEFDLEQTDNKVTGYVHSERRFKLVPQEIDGQTMPNETWKPAIGDKYAVFGMMMPDAYVSDNDTKSGASWDMFREAAKYLYDNAMEKFTFTGILDGIWAKEDWVNIGGKIRLGGYILFKDEQLQDVEDGEENNGVLIRIVGIKDNVNNPHYPTITLSNDPIHGNIRSDLAKIPENEVVSEQLSKDVRQFAKRGFRDARETMQMLSDSLLNFSEGINPMWVQTMQLLNGDDRLQFRFVTNKIDPQIDTGFQVNYDPETKQLSVTSGILQHMTHGIENLSSSHKASEYQYWDMDAYISAVLADPAKKYYLYAKCADDHADNTFMLSETAIALDWNGDYYYLLVGILNSENEGDRSFAPMYGFTEILPGRITTDKVISSNGLNFFDLITGALRSGRFDSAGNMIAGLDIDPNRSNVAILKGTLSQSPSGDTSVVPTDRGAFDASKVYYVGDQVQYSGTTYICIQLTTAGILPTNASYWKVYAAKGTDGTNGDSAKSFSIVAPTQLFKYDNSSLKGTPTPESITLSIAVQNLVVSTVTWTMIDESGGVTNMGTGLTLDVLPILMQDYKTARFRAVMGSYSDEVTLFKIGDGDSSYTVILSNENHAIACDAAGTPLSGELVTNQVTFAGRAKCQVSMFRGAQQLPIHPVEASRYSVSVVLTPTNCSTIQGLTMPVNYTELGISAITADSAFVDVAVTITDSETGTSASITRRMTLVKQKKGNSGRIFSNRGKYSSTASYVGDSQIAQVVYINTGTEASPVWQFYYTSESAGTFTGITPPNTAKWVSYGANFESLATGLAFIDKALIAGFNFYNDRIESSVLLNGIVSILLNGIDGSGHFAGGNLLWDALGNILMKGSFLGKIESNANGNRIVIDPTDRSIKVYKGDFLSNQIFIAGTIDNFADIGTFRTMYQDVYGDVNKIDYTGNGMVIYIPNTDTVGSRIYGRPDGKLGMSAKLPASSGAISGEWYVDDNGFVKIKS
ncbi:MAG: hypothetical protein ACK5LF_14585 [Bacteroides xylanisolvens]